ncbi:MAG: hypothetical protein K6F32_01035, partial [Bacilli bacterium]|nr:hypothetical protein [Bacilli bacterium]
MKKIQRLLLLLPMLGLAACGSSNEETQTMDPDFPMLTDTRPEEEETAVFKTLNGERVEDNKNTRKIVCIFGSPDVVSFGIKILAYEKTTETKGFESLYGDAVALTMNYSAEEVLSYHPELILVNQAMSQTQRETFSKIAPVIPLYNDSDDVSVRLNYIGEIFGLEESATKLISYAETLQQKTIDEINSWGLGGKTLTVFTYMGGITIPPSRNFFFATILYDYLKFERLQIVKDFMEDDSILA